MRISSRVAVGSPTFRLASLVAFTMALIVTLGAAVVAGASLLPSPPPTPPGCADVVCAVAPLAEGRSVHTATRLADGSVLIIGGATDFWSKFPLSAERWDPDTSTFREAGSLLQGREGHTATLLPDGRVLVTGGWIELDQAGRDQALTSAEVWDPGAQSFSATGSMAVPRAGHTTALLPDGRVLVIGGSSNATPAEGSTTEIWDPVSGTFSAGPSLAGLGTDFSAVQLSDGRVLVARRLDAVRPPSEILDPVSMSSTPTGAVSGTGGFKTVLLADGRVLAVGAFAEVWDPATGVFTPTGSPSGHYSDHHTVTLLGDGRVVVISGPAEIWDAVTGTFGAVGPTLPIIGQQTATLLQDGRVLVVGGFDGTSQALDAAAVWDLGGVVGVPATASPSAGS